MGFKKNTNVLIDHHSFILIENFSKEQGLLGYDLQNYEYMNSHVKNNSNQFLNSHIKIYLENNLVLSATPNQLFRVEDEWVEAQNLKVGDFCKLSDELSFIEDIEIEKIEEVVEKLEFYEFSFVQPNGIFFVDRIMVRSQTLTI